MPRPDIQGGWWDPKGEWRERDSGLFVSVDVAPMDCSPQDRVDDTKRIPKPGTRPPRRSPAAEWVTARATQLTALIAFAALVVSVLALWKQEADQNNQREAALRVNASRVHPWFDERGYTVQNSSSAALGPLVLTWISSVPSSDTTLLQVGWSTLEPCTRWLVSNADPDIMSLDRQYTMDGVSFIDARGAWNVPNLIGEIEGPTYDPPPGAAVRKLDGNPTYMHAESVAGCSTS